MTKESRFKIGPQVAALVPDQASSQIPPAHCSCFYPLLPSNGLFFERFDLIVVVLIEATLGKVSPKGSRETNEPKFVSALIW